MTKQSLKVVFFGNERLATGVTTTTPTVTALLAANYVIAAAVTNEETAVSRKSRRHEIAEFAAVNNIPVLSPARLSEIESELKNFAADLGVLVAYGKLVPPRIIDLFKFGILNIHPSLLPLHRGPTPIESVILSGESQTGVSIMQLSPRMDAGPVYAQRSLSVPSQISKQNLSEKLLQMGSELLIQILPDILSGTIVPEAQNESEATYDSMIKKLDGQIDWNKPADVLERQIRAYQDWPKSIAKLKGHEIIVTGAAVVNTSGKPGEFNAGKDELVVFCGQNALSIKSVQPPNKREMPIEAFLAGHAL